MESWLKDVGILAVGWLLGRFSDSVNRDRQAVENCLYDLHILKNLLNELSKYTGYQSRGENGFYKRLIEIEFVVERLHVEKTGLAFSCNMLNDQLTESLIIFKQLDPDKIRAFGYTKPPSEMVNAYDKCSRADNASKKVSLIL